MDDVAKLKGTWKGSVLFDDAPGGEVTVEFTADTVTFTLKGRSISHPYVIDTTKDPKWIDLKGRPGSDPPQPTRYGTYKLDGDKLRLDLGYHGKRPGRTGGSKLADVYRLTRK